MLVKTGTILATTAGVIAKLNPRLRHPTKTSWYVQVNLFGRIIRIEVIERDSRIGDIEK